MGTQCTHKTKKLDLLNDFLLIALRPRWAQRGFVPTGQTKKTNKNKQKKCRGRLLLDGTARQSSRACHLRCLAKNPNADSTTSPQDHELVAGDCHRADALRNLTEKEICAVTVASDEFVWKRRCCGISVGVFGKAAQMARPT